MSHMKTFCKDPLITIANHFYTALVCFVLLMLAFAVAFQHVEAAQNLSLSQCFYWANITASTAGYGDISPKTEIGRWLAIAQVWSGIVMGALVIAHIVSFRRNKETEELLCEFQALLDHFNIEVDYNKKGNNL